MRVRITTAIAGSAMLFVTVLAAQEAPSGEYVQAMTDIRGSARDVWVAADLSSAEGVDFAAAQMIETCQSCHDVHREEVSEGTYHIK